MRHDLGRLDLDLSKVDLGMNMLDLGAVSHEEGFLARMGVVVAEIQLGKGF